MRLPKPIIPMPARPLRAQVEAKNQELRAAHPTTPRVVSMPHDHYRTALDEMLREELIDLDDYRNLDRERRAKIYG